MKKEKEKKIDDQLKKQSSSLMIIISCIVVLMVITYFGVSFTQKGTYSDGESNYTCNSSYFPNKVSVALSQYNYFSSLAQGGVICTSSNYGVYMPGKIESGIGYCVPSAANYTEEECTSIGGVFDTTTCYIPCAVSPTMVSVGGACTLPGGGTGIIGDDFECHDNPAAVVAPSTGCYYCNISGAEAYLYYNSGATMNENCTTTVNNNYEPMNGTNANNGSACQVKTTPVATITGCHQCGNSYIYYNKDATMTAGCSQNINANYASTSQNNGDVCELVYTPTGPIATTAGCHECGEDYKYYRENAEMDSSCTQTVSEDYVHYTYTNGEMCTLKDGETTVTTAGCYQCVIPGTSPFYGWYNVGDKYNANFCSIAGDSNCQSEVIVTFKNAEGTTTLGTCTADTTNHTLTATCVDSTAICGGWSTTNCPSSGCGNDTQQLVYSHDDLKTATFRASMTLYCKAGTSYGGGGGGGDDPTPTPTPGDNPVNEKRCNQITGKVVDVASCDKSAAEIANITCSDINDTSQGSCTLKDGVTKVNRCALGSVTHAACNEKINAKKCYNDPNTGKGEWVTVVTCDANGNDGNCTLSDNRVVARKYITESNGCNTGDNPKTGTNAIMIAWIAGALAIAYALYYFTQTNKNEG